jgi:hypothetical protein
MSTSSPGADQEPIAMRKNAGGAGRDHDSFRRDRQAVAIGVELRDGFAERTDAERVGVTHRLVLQRRDRGFDDRLRRREIRLPDLHVYDTASARLDLERTPLDLHDVERLDRVHARGEAQALAYPGVVGRRHEE